MKRLTIVLLFESMFLISTACAVDKSEINEYEKSVSIAVKPLKQVYEPNESVTLIVAIANHRSEPIYIRHSESDYYERSRSIRDVNGISIKTGPTDTPLPPPVDYYMEKNGKSTFVVPVYKIDGFSLLIAIVNDALKNQHKHNINVPDGIYYVDPFVEDVIHEADEIIERENVSTRFWVEPGSPMVKVRHKSNSVKIEIRKKEE